ncbi:MAG: TadE family protein [Verrucomicrobiota bacterium]
MGGNAGGQATIEFALVLIPFFLILFCIIDFAHIYFYENALQNAMREAARFATAGRIIQATNADGSAAYETNSAGIVVPKAINDTQGREASRNECIRYWFQSNCVIGNFPATNLLITSAPTLPGMPAVTSTNSIGQLTLLSGYTVTTNSNHTVSTNSVPAVKGPGGADDYVQVTAVYSVGTITPLVSAFFPCRVSAIVKNEPALLNFEHNALYTNEP